MFWVVNIGNQTSQMSGGDSNNKYSMQDVSRARREWLSAMDKSSSTSAFLSYAKTERDRYLGDLGYLQSYLNTSEDEEEKGTIGDMITDAEESLEESQARVVSLEARLVTLQANEELLGTHYRFINASYERSI